MTVHLLTVLVSVMAAATSVLFIKTSGTDPVWLSCYRVWLAALLLLPVYLREMRRHRPSARMLWRRSLWPGVLLAAHFILWIAGARMTAAANATLIVNMVPVAMPFALVLLARERVTRIEVVGTVISIGGVCLLAGGDVRFDMHHFRGDVVCFVSMLFYTLYLAKGRRNRDLPSIWLYVVPIYTITGICCALVGLARATVDPAANPLAGPWRPVDLLAIAGLAIVPTILGHSLINQALRHLRGQLVVLLNTSQFIFASIGAWLLLHEAPRPIFYPAAIIVTVGAVVVVLYSARGHRPSAPDSPEET